MYGLPAPARLLQGLGSIDGSAAATAQGRTLRPVGDVCDVAVVTAPCLRAWARTLSA